MKKSIIDIKNLWKAFSYLTALAGMTCIFLSYFLMKNMATSELDAHLRASLSSVNEQITYGNYRRAIEIIASDPKVTDIEIRSNHNLPIQLSTNHSKNFKVCINNKVSNGDFNIRICKSEDKIINIIILILVASILIITFGYFYLLKIENNAATRIKESLADFGISFNNTQNKNQSIFDELKIASELFKKSIEMKIQIEKLKTKNESSEQVAHDIRSPLTALEMISKSLTGVPEAQLLILKSAINRIRDITNTLAKKPTKNSESTNTKDKDILQQKMQNEPLYPIVDSIVAEKRIQYCNSQLVRIEFNKTKNSCELFSKIDPIEFKRILSNLINNSVEALNHNSGTVSVELTSLNEEVLIEIQDTGCGISKDLIQKLGNRGATFNKSGGTGLGLYHAKTTLESWGGHLEINSEVGQGTRIVIHLPKQTHSNHIKHELNSS